jgi:aminopeptidase N
VLRREDYRPPQFGIPAVHLCIDLRDDHAVITSVMKLERLPWCADAEVVLDGDCKSVQLLSVAGAGGVPLSPQHFTLDAASNSLRIAAASVFPSSAAEFGEVTVVTRVEPQHNTMLHGL